MENLVVKYRAEEEPQAASLKIHIDYGVK